MDIDKFFLILLVTSYLCFDVNGSNEDRLNKSLAKYDHIGSVVNDMIKVYKNRECGFVNFKGKEVISPRKGYKNYKNISHFYFDYCPLLVDDTIALFSKKGKIIKTPKIINLDGTGEIFFQDKTAIMVKDKIIYLDMNNYSIFKLYGDKYFRLRCEDEKKRYVSLYNDKGNKIMEYDDIDFMVSDCYAEGYSEKYFIAKSKGKYGIVDNKNHLIVPFTFDQSEITFTGKYVICRQQTENHEISKEIILSLTCDTLSPIEYDRHFTYKDFIFVWKGLDCDIIRDNKFVDNFEFGNNIVKKDSTSITISTLTNKFPIEYFRIDGNLLIYKVNGNYGIIDKKGKEILPCKFSEIDSYSNNNLIIAYDTMDNCRCRSGSVMESLYDRNGICLKENMCFDNDEIDDFSLFTSFSDKNRTFIWNDKKKKMLELRSGFVELCNKDYYYIKCDDKIKFVKIKWR